MGHLQPDVHEAYATPRHEHRTAVLGMWAFLVSEAMLFGGFFLAYTVMRGSHGAAFAEGSGHLGLFWGSVNTGLLLLSSFFVVWGERAYEFRRYRQGAVAWLFAAALGLGFLSIKGYEYAEKIHQHHLPGDHFRHADFTHPAGAELFHWCYFAMTGLHALHLLVAIAWLAGLVGWFRFRAGRALPPTYVTAAALYWHFVDLIWVFLFPLLYLDRG